MGASPYTRERLAAAVAESKNWADLMRRLGLKKSGGQRRVLQEKVAGHGLDITHFRQRSPWRKYPDAAIAAAGIDVSHFPGMNRPQLGLLFTADELKAAPRPSRDRNCLSLTDTWCRNRRPAKSVTV